MRTGSSGGLGRLRKAVTSRLPRRTTEADEPEPADRAPVQTAGSPAPALPDEPLLSVVVPMYQVEEYLAECLDSVLAQNYANLEVILVDDGSTDSTAAIANTYVDRDPRFRLVQKVNAGLGAARNTGLEHCTGQLVAFVDSDDTLPPGAYMKMVRTLVSSGSDFVVGAHVRDQGGERIQRAWVKELHDRRRLGVTVDDVPDVLANVFAWTKVFRRDFIDRIGLRFPEGVRYEDQVPITRAYLEARAFDIVAAPVYIWRKRDDETSITQQKGQAADLHDRLAAKREIAAMLAAKASDVVLHGWYVKVFRFDLMPYFRAAATGEDDYWHVLRDDVVALYEKAPAGVWDDVELRFRLATFLAATGQREALVRLLDYEPLPTSNFPVRVEGEDIFAELDFLDAEALGLPQDMLRLRPVDLPLRARLSALDWSEPGRLTVGGLSFIRHVDPSVHPVTTELSLVRPKDGRAVPARVRTAPDPDADTVAGRVHENHTDSAFLATFDLRELVRISADQPRTTWDAELALSALGHEVGSRFREVEEFGSALSTRAQLVDGALVSGSWSDIRGLSLLVRSRFAALRAASHDGDRFLLEVELSAGLEVAGVLVKDVPVPATVEAGPGSTVRVRIRPADLVEAGEEGAVGLDVGEEAPLEVVDLSGLDWLGSPAPGQPMALSVNSRSLLRVIRDQPVAVVDRVDLDGTTARMEGHVHGVEGLEVRLSGPRATTPAATAEIADGRFTVEVPVTRTFWGGVSTVLPRNAYTPVGTDAQGTDVWFRASLGLQDAAAAAAVAGWTLEVGERRALTLRRARDLPPGTASARVQHQLRSGRYADARRGPRAETMVFESFGGASVGDSPRALCDLLLATDTGLDLVWSVNDEAVPVPEGTRAVPRLSPEWYSVVGSARFLVSNNNFPAYFEKAPGQVHVQTWHGTPLKRIGHDIEDTRFFNPGYLRLMDREAQGWDFLVSPSPFCTDILPRALATPARVLEIGYPRNDLLLSPDAAAIGRQVREDLGIDPGQRVLLYAPTWRENARVGGTYQKVLHLDVDEIVAAREDVTVLVRGHSNVAGRATVGDGARVLDVTSYPDPARLYLAADLLVTDYSSVFFDFALTDKPILFLVPDLEDYRDRLRGFYVDLAEIAPGPLLRSTDEVLAHLDDDPATFAAARDGLRSRFAPHDDGRAAERLMRALLGPG